MEKLEKYEIKELEAWKLMMDSMVKFIEASTKVMNTFTEKANSHLKLPIISSCEIKSMLGPALSALDYSREKFTRSSRPESAPEIEEPENISDSDYEHKGRRTKKGKSARSLKENISTKLQSGKTEKFVEVLEGNEVDNTNKCSITFDNTSPLLENVIKLVPEDESHSAPEHLETTKEYRQETDFCCPVGELQNQTEYDLKEDKKMSTESVTRIMALKLEEAQNEIDYLKNELIKIQSTKNNNVSPALYKIYDKTPKSPNSTRAENEYDNTQNIMSTRKANLPSRSLISPTESCRQSSAKCHQSTVTQRRSIPLRMRPRISTNEMVYLRNNNMQQRRRVQSTTGYEQLPIEMYNPNYQPYQRQMYPIFTRPPSPEAESFFNTQSSTIDPGYNYQTGQSVYQTCEGNDHFRNRKSENYLSMSDEASGEEYLCDSELF